MANKKQEYANAYDKILKENIFQTIKPFLKQMVGIDIENKKIEYIPTSLQKTLEVEADFLGKILHQNKKDDFILHLEFQSQDNLKMQNRMLFYQGFLRLKYTIPIQQYVIYLGKGTSKMKTFIKDNNLDFTYNLINFQDFDIGYFIESNIPEVVILGILANYKGENAEKIIDKILKKIISVEIDITNQQKYVQQLEMLSNLRNLQEVIKQKINNMAFVYDLKNDIRFKEGQQEERQKYEAERQKYEDEIQKYNLERQKSVLKLHQKKISLSDIADSLNMSKEEVEKIIKNQ
ncbi:MAG: hypothetical protein EAZ85_07175 [Bacteroidetes bacterium]|nr:MAG: hypothetical protein EAZ85_07175 [Bacteroidota bacterium]TAG85520.1 MAG: hypothetical protein EAZ20_14920 [Bacteroidota bacterium]